MSYTMNSSTLSNEPLLLPHPILMILIGHVLLNRLGQTMLFPLTTRTFISFPSLILTGVQLRWHLRCRGRFWMTQRMTLLVQSSHRPHRLNLDLFHQYRISLILPLPLTPVPLMLLLHHHLQSMLLFHTTPTAFDILIQDILGLTLSTLHPITNFVPVPI